MNRLHWSECFRLAELDPTEHLFQKFGRILAGWIQGDMTFRAGKD